MVLLLNFTIASFKSKPGMILFLIAVTFWSARLVWLNREELAKLSWWRQIVAIVIMVVGTPFFMVEEILEILLDWIMEDEG